MTAVRLALTLSAGLIAVGSVHAEKLSLASMPLYLSSTAPPNIMLMLDNSGSMSNIVPESSATLPQYNSATTYLSSCPSSNQVPTDQGVDLNVKNSDGQPYILQGGNRYAWGTGSGQRCFVTGTTYGTTAATAYRLNADSAGQTNGFFTVGSGYLGTSYSGNYLNWYFNPSSVSGVTWNGKQRVKPLVSGASCTGTGTPTSSCVKSRIQIARDGAANLVGELDADLRVGFSTYNSGTGGLLLDPVGTLGAAGSTKRTNLVSTINSLNASGATPLMETLQDIGRYFANGYTGNLTLHPGAANASTDSVASVFNNHKFANGSSVSSTAADAAPITLSCQRSFAVVLTDGRPSADRAISTDLRDYIGDCAAGRCNATSDDAPDTSVTVTTSNLQSLKNGVQVGRTYEAAGSDYLDDMAAALNDIDLRPDFAAESSTGSQFKNNVVSYFVGFADPAVQNDPLLQSSALNGGSSTIRIANDSAALATVFSNIVSNILATSSSAGSAAASSTQLNTGTRVLQGSFNSGDWSGDLQSFKVSTGGGSCATGTTPALGELCPNAEWSAAAQLANQTSRNILTYDPASRTGVAFRFSGTTHISTTQADQLKKNGGSDTDTDAQNRLSFLRGDLTQDGKSATPRKRGSKLGDIVNSSPVYVGPPSAVYSDSTYASFRTDATNSARAAMVYVAANDGMLHGFLASTGDEKFAYVPSTAFGSGSNQPLYNLTQTPFSHAPIVDGPLAVTDAKVSNSWKSVLIGSLGGGGRGIYALDVTNGASITETTTSKALWEFTSADDADLGYTVGQPSIVKMKNGQWAAIFGNGYTTTSLTETFGSGKSCLFIAFLEGPTSSGWGTVSSGGTGLSSSSRYVKICTNIGDTTTPNGLAAPAAVDVDRNSDEAVDFIYAGDERGNLWRFDVNNSDPAQWKVAYGGTPLFTTSDGTNPQPITEQPEVGYNLNNGAATSTSDPKLAIYFGTGRYLGKNAGGTSDISTSGVQTFYGIFDNNLTATSTSAISPATTRSNLRAQFVTKEVNASGANCTGSAINASGSCFRVTSQNAVTSSDKGWYIDLYNTNGADANTKGSATATYGERQVTTPILRGGRIIFTTLIPSTDPCSPGGGGWVMELEAKSGGRTASPTFNTNSDRVINQDDFITIGSTKIAVSGSRSNVGVPSAPTIINLPTPGLEIKHYSGTGRNGVTRDSLLESAAGRVGRITWREIIQ